MKPALLDTGFIVALFNKSDRFHARCASILDQLESPLATCEAVITESCFLLRHAPGGPEYVLTNVAKGIFEIPFRLTEAGPSISKLFQKYRNLPSSLADCCLVQMADELDTGDILTLDSDFRHYRWRRNHSFNLLVPLD